MNGLKAAIGDTISAIYAAGRPKDGLGGRALMYHAVGGEVVGDSKQLYSIAPDNFAKHVRCLVQTFGGHVVPLDRAVSEGRGIAITFDDGYRDNLTVAAPLLLTASMPFTVFVALDLVDSGRPQYLSRAELKDLSSLPGAEIGAHGRSHRALTQMSDAELAEEVGSSKAGLEDLLGRPVTTMSYPHGAVDARVRTAVQRAGYHIAASSRFGSVAKDGDPFDVPRIDVWASDGTSRLLAKARGHWDWMGWRT